jgi:hypothetical protein
MWCANCQADVAAEVTADNRRILCATCGEEISSPNSYQSLAKTREARELLERWSNSRMLDPLSSPTAANSPADALPLSHRPFPAPVEKKPATPTFRLDSPHPLGGQAVDAARTGATDAQAIQFAHQPHYPISQPTTRQHAAHGAAPAPHFDVQAAIERPEARRGNWSSLIGQLLAYGGVAMLTVGTTLVLWGYFGGEASYAPTGWLVTTAGQMLLFLGVVTLVSGGLEQTTDEVSRRIETLGDKILRIEMASKDHALRGPSIPAEQFVEGAPRRASRSAHVRE